jgi:hypothetical protein
MNEPRCIAAAVAGCSLPEVEHTFTRNVCEPINAVALVSGEGENKSGFTAGCRRGVVRIVDLYSSINDPAKQ